MLAWCFLFYITSCYLLALAPDSVRRPGLSFKVRVQGCDMLLHVYVSYRALTFLGVCCVREHQVMDCLALDLGDACIDVVVDKGTLDALVRACQMLFACHARLV